MAVTYRITTLGCRVNHAETREIESILRTRGLIRAEPRHRADLEIVHTCSVTNTAGVKSRQAIRRAAGRQRSGSQDRALSDHRIPSVCNSATPEPSSGEVWVTGCYASTDGDRAATLAGGADRVLGHEIDDAGRSLHDRLAERLDLWLDSRSTRSIDRATERGRREPIRSPKAACCSAAAGERLPSLNPLPAVAPCGVPGRHVRAELKIQDGCDAHCTFCILPRIRPTLRSKRVRDAVDEARRLVELGHREIVLSGIFIGAYGHETALRRRQTPRGRDPLADLLDAVARVPGLERVRISSMEPGDVSPALLDAMVANAPVVVPHLHLPLQSGSDRILRRMNRQYTTDEYRAMIADVSRTLTTADGLPPAITTDIICGFPGETENDFEQTERLIRDVGFLHLHVFPFSPRRGTAAARWTDRFVPEHVARRRVRHLIDLEHDPDDGLSIAWRRRLEGRSVRVILEQPDKADPARMTGRCDHYAVISVKTRLERGTLVIVRVDDVQPSITLGRIERQPLTVLL